MRSYAKLCPIPPSWRCRHDPPSCPLPKQLQALLQQSLPAQEGVRLTRHLDTCAACKEEYEEQRRLWEVHCAHAAQAPARPPRLRGYDIEPTPFARGSFGGVHKAWHRQLAGWHALKVLRLEHVSPANVHSFRDEARLMQQLPNHPHRVPVLDYRPLRNGAAVLIMPYLEGGSLRRFKDGKVCPWSWEVAVRFALQAGEGLRDLHACGFLHRDLKPSNILLDNRPADPVAKLADFGLASLTSISTGLCGTAGYVAPELLNEALSPKSDVFSLTATLYALITGHPPFDNRDLYIGVRQAQTPLPWPAPGLGNVPTWLEEAIHLGLEPDPNRRIGLDDLLERLEDVSVAKVLKHLELIQKRLATTLIAGSRATPPAPHSSHVVHEDSGLKPPTQRSLNISMHEGPSSIDILKDVISSVKRLTFGL